MSFVQHSIRLFIIAFFIICASFQTHADNFDKLLDANGDAILNVRQMLFDQEGYLWLGGDEGVHRFDGYHKVRVNNEPTDGLYLDNQNRFWSRGTTTLLAFDKDDYSTIEYPNLSTKEIKPEHEITYQMYQTQNGRQFFATKEGLSEYFYQQNRFDHYDINIPTSEAKLSITVLLETPSNHLLVGSKRGLYQIPLASINGLGQSLDVSNPLIDNVRITTLNFHQNQLYVGTDNGLYVIDAQGNIAAHYFHVANNQFSLTHNNVTAVLIDHLGYLWVGTSKGLNRQAPNSNQFTRYYQNESDPYSITNNLITDLHQDKQQNIFIATYSGINRFHHTDVHIQSHPLLSQLEQSINNVWSLAEDQGQNLWIGTFGSGLIRLNKDGSVRHFNPNKNNPNAIASNRIPTLLIDKNQQVLVGTNKGLQRFEPISQSFITIPLVDKNERDKTTEQILDIVQNDDGHYWLTTPKGVIELDNQQQATFYDKHSALKVVYRQWVRSVLPLDHRILVGSDKGLHILDKRSNQVTQLAHAGSVLKILEDSQNNIWVISLSDVMLFDRHNNQLHSLEQPPANPFKPDEVKTGCNNGVEDHHQQLWLVCGPGIKVVDINSKKLIASYSKQDKVDMSGFLTGSESMIVTQNRTILMSERNGITQFQPNLQQRITGQLNLVLSHIQGTFDKSYQEQQQQFNHQYLFAQTNRVQQQNIHYSLQKLEFQFSALDMARPKATNYRYRLQGYDQNWTNTESSNRRAIYTNLPPGNYTFEVEAKAFGQPITALKYDFSIATKPWLSWWAYCLYAIAALLSIYTLIIARTHSLKSQQIELEHRIHQRTSELRDSKQQVEQLMRERQKLIENIYHQTRTPLQIIQGNITALINKQLTPQQYAAKQNEKIDALVQLTDQILDVSRVSQIDRAPLERINLSALLKPPVASFVDVANTKGLKFEWHIDDDIYINASGPSMENVIDNLLSNAVKYTNSGSIKLKVEIEQRAGQPQVAIRCIDTGIGIPDIDQPSIFLRYQRASNSKSKQGAGIGLAMVKEVIESIDGQIELSSSQNQGTEIAIFIPLAEQQSDIHDQTTADDDSQYQQLQQQLSEQKDHADKASLLIVEDNIELTQYTISLLQPHYQITTARNGEEGLALAKENVPDLILSDVMMDKMDGYQFTKAIRADEITCHIPLILVTAKSDNMSREQGYALGASDFITKPFKQSDLLNRINNQLQQIRALQKRLRPTTEQPQVIDKEEDRLITRYLTYVSTHYQDNTLKIKDICSDLHISARQLERKVRHFLDMTPNELLNDYRLARAKELLAQGNNVSRVYEQCGFSSHAYFSKRYKEKFGHLPSQLKKQKSAS